VYSGDGTAEAAGNVTAIEAIAQNARERERRRGVVMAEKVVMSGPDRLTQWQLR
jgi:predicted Fe-Mo cluster-binding NifX family protein